jgi:LysR family nitrogen assimilation transcriptional regulator
MLCIKVGAAMSSDFPPRRSKSSRTTDAELASVLEEMMMGTENITAHAVTRRMLTISHASTLTRDSWRMSRIKEAEQKRIRMRCDFDNSSLTVRSPMQSLDFNAVRNFVKVAHTGNYGRAASDLGISPSALSRSVERLEQYYGLQLMFRHGKGVALTDAGSALLDKFEAILNLLDSPLPHPAAVSSSPKHVRISLPSDVGSLLAPSIVRRVRASWPDVSLDLKEADGLQVERWLLSNQLDLAFAIDPAPIPDFIIKPLRADALGVVAPPSSPLGESDSPLDLRDIARLPFILPDDAHPVRRRIALAASQCGIRLQPLLILNNFTLTVALIRAGHGYGLATQAAIREYLARGSLVFRPLRRPLVASTYALVLVKDPSRFALELATALEDIVSDIV